MSHGFYDSNLGSEILILVGDIKSSSYIYIGGTYSIWSVKIFRAEILTIFSLLFWKIDTS